MSGPLMSALSVSVWRRNGDTRYPLRWMSKSSFMTSAECASYAKPVTGLTGRCGVSCQRMSIPERFLSRVCRDVFSMPAVEWLGQTFDAFLMCVDRHSGWMIAKPTQKAGLAGEKAAHLMLHSTWGEVGIPSVITSDQGPQFVTSGG